MPAKSTKIAPKLGRRDVNAACIVIRIDPAKFAVRETALCLSTKTNLMFNKRRLAAGRAAVLAALFKIYPELDNNFSRATAAFRAGDELGEPDWDYFNELGAQALGIPRRDIKGELK